MPEEEGSAIVGSTIWPELSKNTIVGPPSAAMMTSFVPGATSEYTAVASRASVSPSVQKVD